MYGNISDSLSVDRFCAQILRLMRRSLGLALCCTLVSFALVQSLRAVQPAEDPLRKAFLLPPDSARPRVWWHWMNGNVTKDGIKLDLEWMHRVGLGGIQNFDASLDTPQLVDKPLVFMTAPWQDTFRYTATLADHLGLELAVAGAPGWSESGGPWVASEDGMKKLVWTETQVAGGVPFAGMLPHPPMVIGPFQNVSIDRNGTDNPSTRGPIHEVYADVAVIAYKLPSAERSMAELNSIVTTSAGAIDSKLLWDGDFTRAVHLTYGSKGAPAWIQVDFRHPQVVQSMSLGLRQGWELLEARHVGAELQASLDGVEFHTVAIAYDTADQSFAEDIPPIEETVTFAPVAARYFRLLLPTPPVRQISPVVANWLWLGPIPKEHQITEFVLHPTPRVDHFEQKAAFFLDAGINPHPTRHVSPTEVLPRGEILDLTSRLHADGTLSWTPPTGRWAILRVGYSLLGITNHPASPAGTGLEVDKLNRTAVKAYMDAYLGRYASMLGPSLIGSHGLGAIVNDSWEAGPQNWTPELPAEFARRRGYDLLPWLPALTGRIIGSAEETDRFLWDFRRTLGELLTENHYGVLAASIHARGMRHYGESHESARAFIGDGMDAKRADNIPMGAMWMPGSIFGQSNSDADIRESASVAHIYGQNLVAAESMTALGVPGAAFALAPETLKPTADRELADGVNLFVLHTSVHQPLSKLGPGLTLGPFGHWFTRDETWAEQAGPWVSYLSRSSYLLQQGHFVADVIYFYGQDSNITALYGRGLPSIPEGYAFDFANAHALNMLSVENGMLVTVSGMRYRVLALDPRTRWMSLDVLKTIAHLVKAGATIIGDKPRSSPSLADSDKEFQSLADAVWGLDGTDEHRYGNGGVLSHRSIARALVQVGLEPDFSYKKSHPNALLWYVHRRTSDGDLYFVNNRRAQSVRVEASFRVIGKAPELWHADSGSIEQASYRVTGDRTIVPLDMAPYEAIFVRFREPTQQLRRIEPELTWQPLSSITGPWVVHFQPQRGAPETSTFSRLESWSTNADPAIRYFSGTAAYEANLQAPASWFANGQRVAIDLGAVKNLAEVLVNEQSAGILWKPPFRADVTSLLRPGANRVTVRVTNLWPNRLIGDKQPNAHPVAFAPFNPYSPSSPLLDSGLLGPVTILRGRSFR
jgi:(4-O-methyl)-D-glucuronate---lignin esterase